MAIESCVPLCLLLYPVSVVWPTHTCFSCFLHPQPAFDWLTCSVASHLFLSALCCPASPVWPHPSLSWILTWWAVLRSEKLSLCHHGGYIIHSTVYGSSAVVTICSTWFKMKEPLHFAHSIYWCSSMICGIIEVIFLNSIKSISLLVEVSCVYRVIGMESLSKFYMSFRIPVVNVIWCGIFSILGRIIRVTDEVIEYRAWIRETFRVPSYSSPLTHQDEDDSLSSSGASEASSLESPTGSDTVSVSH